MMRRGRLPGILFITKPFSPRELALIRGPRARGHSSDLIADNRISRGGPDNSPNSGPVAGPEQSPDGSDGINRPRRREQLGAEDIPAAAEKLSPDKQLNQTQQPDAIERPEHTKQLNRPEQPEQPEPAKQLNQPERPKQPESGKQLNQPEQPGPEGQPRPDGTALTRRNSAARRSSLKQAKAPKKPRPSRKNTPLGAPRQRPLAHPRLNCGCAACSGG